MDGEAKTDLERQMNSLLIPQMNADQEIARINANVFVIRAFQTIGAGVASI